MRPERNPPSLVLGALLLVPLLAGCMADGPHRLEGPDGLVAENGIPICGLVVDAEFLPIANATVGTRRAAATVATDAAGGFCLGPFPPGTEVDLWAEAPGFATAAITARTDDHRQGEMVTLVLQHLPGREPYHEVQTHVAFIECAWAISFLGTLPCNPVDRTLGTEVTVDNSQHFFDIPSPDLVALLFEAEWSVNPVGEDMRFILFIPDIIEGGAATGDPILDGRGGSPFATWLFPDQPGDRAQKAFEAEPGTPYQMLYRPWTTNSSLEVIALYVNHRVESYYTFFYHRIDTPEFSALPER